MHRIFYFLAVILTAIATPLFAEGIPAELDELAQEVRQAVVVEAGNDVTARVSAWERKDADWVQVMSPIEAVIGRNGLAPLDEKREGDGRTPSGIFRLRRAFGYEDHVPTGLQYHRVTEKDFWIDEPASPQYNQWVVGDVPAVSHEVLQRKDDLYKYAIVIEYNTDPVVPELGSAIFMHVWGAEHEPAKGEVRPPKARFAKGDQRRPTAGCVAMAEADLLQFLHWLDIHQHPVIVLTRILQ